MFMYNRMNNILSDLTLFNLGVRTPSKANLFFESLGILSIQGREWTERDRDDK